MKESKEKLGYQIQKEFEQMRGRFDQTPWLFLFVYVMCSMLIYMQIGSFEGEENIWLSILTTVEIVIAVIGFVIALAYWILSHLGKGQFIFRICVFGAFFTFRLNMIGIAIVITNTLFYAELEQKIGLICIIGALVFMIGDTIRFCNLYKKGQYSDVAQSYQFHFGKQEKIVAALIIGSEFPILFRGIRLTLHYTSIPQEILNVYGVYLVCLVFCMLNRMSIKAFVNLKMCRRSSKE